MVAHNFVQTLHPQPDDVIDIIQMIEVFSYQPLQSTSIQMAAGAQDQSKPNRGPIPHLLGLREETLVQLDDVVADEPHEVGEVGYSRLVPDVLQHGWISD